MVNIGIIGCGGIAKGRHIPGYLANPHANLITVYDPVPGRAVQAAKGTGAVPYDNLENMLRHPGLEAVSVCTPERYHRDIAIQALRAGMHVLCEKPMALNAVQAKEMEREAKACGKILMIAHNQRIYEPHWKARELLESKVIGEPLAFRTFLSHAGPEAAVKDEDDRKTFYDRYEGNGGVMLSVGCHRIDLIPWLFGKRITEVMAYTPVLDKKHSDGSPISAEDTAMIIVKCGNGLTGMFYTSWCVYGCADRETQIFGTEGTMKLFEDPWSVAIYKRNGEKIYYDLNAFAAKGSQGATGIIDRFVECVSERKEAFVTAFEGIWCMEVLDAVKESGKSGRWVTVNYETAE